MPGIICKGQLERLRNSHTSCCLFRKDQLGGITSLWELITPFLIKKYKESRRIWETIWRMQRNILEPLRVLFCLWPYMESCDVYLGTDAKSWLKTWVLEKAISYGDEWLGNESAGKTEDKIATHPTGNQAVPTREPDWDYYTGKERWDQSHFVRCVLEGLSNHTLKL